MMTRSGSVSSSSMPRGSAPTASVFAVPAATTSTIEPPVFHPDELPTVAVHAQRAPRAPSGARPAGSNASGRSATTEGAEIDLLAQAQESLRSRPAETLALCEKHRAEFAKGRFTQEREALAIEALLYLHRRSEAERRWSDFQERYPASNHRIHLADLFSSPSP
jgi:hypothetical protein